MYRKRALDGSAVVRALGPSWNTNATLLFLDQPLADVALAAAVEHGSLSDVTRLVERDLADPARQLDLLFVACEHGHADVLRESARVQLENALNTLDERELRIIRLYFGLDGNEALTLEEIGDMMNLTRERIRQLKERALSKLRHPSRNGALKSLSSEV